MFRRIMRWLVMGLGGLLIVMLVALFAAYVWSQGLVSRVYAAPQVEIAIPIDAATIARGKYLAQAVSVCVDCHGDKLQGGVVVDDPALGRVVAPNLTTGQGGIGAQRSDADFVRVLRYGILPDGTSAKVMPSDDYQHLTDADLAAIIAYVRSVPAQESALPPAVLGPLGRILLATGQLPILIAERVEPNTQYKAIPAGITPEYGRYLADIAGCTGCHGPGLSGGPIPAAPPDWPQASNLTPSGEVGQWSEEDFVRTIRSGVTPAQKTLDVRMPWPRYSSMSDDDLRALWAYIRTVRAKPAGTR